MCTFVSMGEITGQASCFLFFLFFFCCFPTDRINGYLINKVEVCTPHGATTGKKYLETFGDRSC
jgi:hypothetical protein